MNYNNKHLDSCVHGMRQSKSKIDFIAGKNKTKIKKKIQNKENRKIK
jgi:hypothetical protein